MIKKKFFAVLAAAAVAFGLVGCQSDVDTGQKIQESQQTTVLEQTEKVSQDVETSKTEAFAESSDNEAETVTIAGEIYDINETGLFLWNMPVTDEDLQKLLYFKKLKNLSIDLLADDCEITDLSVLSQLDILETLCINGTYDDLSFLKDMTGLTDISLLHFSCNTLKNVPYNTAVTEIDVDESEITNLNWISNFPNLEKISFNHFSGTDFNAIGELKNLETFSLTFSSIDVTDFSFLGNLKSLKNLTFTPFPSDKIYDFDALSNCTDLEELSISGTYKDLEFCKSLINLKKLSIISDSNYEYDISPIIECVNLQELELYCNFDEVQFNSLKNALVNCTIIKQGE